MSSYPHTGGGISIVRTITISQLSFSVRDRFSAGQTLSAAEAEILNGWTADKIREAVRPRKGTTKTEREMASEIAALDEGDFAETWGRGRSPETEPGTLLAERLQVAKERLQKYLARYAATITTPTQTLQEQFFSDPEVIAEARRRFEIRQAQARQVLAELELGGMWP